MTEALRNELRALLTRAATVEAQRQAALQRGDRQAVRDAESELSRIWSRVCGLQQGRVA